MELELGGSLTFLLADFAGLSLNKLLCRLHRQDTEASESNASNCEESGSVRILNSSYAERAK